MDFRGLTEEMLKPGVVVTIEGFVSTRTSNEVRAGPSAIDRSISGDEKAA